MVRGIWEEMVLLSGSRLAVRDKIIVALDVPTIDQALALVDLTRESVGMYKVGMELFYGSGVSGLLRLQERGAGVFLDLKLHDIPNTVRRTSRILSGLGVAMFNVHCSGGREMMEAAVAGADEGTVEGQSRPVILGVTLLTSIGQDMLQALGVERSVPDHVTSLATMADRSGLSGVVASPLEIRQIKEACGDRFLVVTPGVRPRWTEAGDQRRFATPAEAISAGADYIVVGRAITASSDPSAAAKRLLEETDVEVTALTSS